MNKILICNLKENNTKQNFAEYLSIISKNKHTVDFVVCPQLPYLHLINEDLKKGAQDVSKYIGGSHTGEVSAHALKDNGVEYCVVGHKERNEEVQDIILKTQNLLSEDINPILIVGENEKKENIKEVLQIVEKQISDVYNQMPYDKLNKIIISYEPKWMIANDEDINVEDLSNIIKTIKSIVSSYYETLPKVIYGGGVNENKIIQLNQIKELDGFIIGTKALDAFELEKIISNMTKIDNEKY